MSNINPHQTFPSNYQGVIVIIDDSPKRIRAISKASAGKGTHLVLSPLPAGLKEEAELITGLTSAGAIVRVLATDEPKAAVKSILDDFAHIDILIIYSEKKKPQEDQHLMSWLKETLPHLKKGRPQGAVVIISKNTPFEKNTIEYLRQTIKAPKNRPALFAVNADQSTDKNILREISTLFNE